ncbi:hypothetical protein L1987_72127 [Smallanthus sonchifolius]|uniref:Uncharacterized protein n=1 Tax=Smallanthus sonchifolius TaxID=185202 RepID=A0ACB9ATH4_9ASTR|nr:hypothetical protein L1987_72127 [Smallanthus sonchifolius]
MYQFSVTPSLPFLYANEEEDVGTGYLDNDGFDDEDDNDDEQLHPRSFFKQKKKRATIINKPIRARVAYSFTSLNKSYFFSFQFRSIYFYSFYIHPLRSSEAAFATANLYLFAVGFLLSISRV